MHQLDRRPALDTLELIQQYDTFLENIKTVADMGCGAGLDSEWWATLINNDDPPEPYNFKVFAVDRSEAELTKVPVHANITRVHKDFTKPTLFPIKMDLVWAHDCLQYSTNPLETLKFWNEVMNVNAMLMLTVPTHSGIEYNRYYSRTYQGCFYHFSPVNLIYMLAVNGFDCNDAYLQKKFNDPMIKLAVYKTKVAPMDPATTTWKDLIDKKLLNPSVVRSLMNHGHIRQEEIIYPWLDRENYFIDWIPQLTELRADPAQHTDVGAPEVWTQSGNTTVQQANVRVKETKTVKSSGIMRPIKPPKQSYKN